MPIADINILVIGKDPEILQVVLRLLNQHQPANNLAIGADNLAGGAHYHAVGATDPDQARSLFADSDIDLVLITNGIDPTLDASLREDFQTRRPGTPILQHYGGGSGLLFAEIAEALTK
jgi:hypothetical protein